MKRPLAVIGFTMLCTLVIFCNINTETTMSVAILASLIVLFLFLLIKPIRQNKTLPTAAFSVFIALILLFVNNSMYYRTAILLSNREIAVTGSLSQLPYEAHGTFYYVIETDTVNGIEESAKIRLSSSSPIDLKPTDRISVTLKTFLLGKDDETLSYYKSKDMFLGGYATSDYKINKGAASSFNDKLLLLRLTMTDKIMTTLPNDYGAVISALTLGDKTHLNSSLTNAFAACGISHLFAVSGLHISIWSMLFYKLAKKLRLRRKSASLISILFCVFFILITGGNPPVVRAGFMMIVVFLSNIFEREAEPFNSIGLALIVMLFFNPYNAVSMSLWLSLLATLGILLLYKPINRFLTKPLYKISNNPFKSFYKGFASTIAVSVAVTVFTLPVYIIELRTISTLLLLSNYLMVWLGTLCMELGGIAVVFLSVGAIFIGKPLMIISGIAAKVILKAVLFFSQFRYALIPVWSVYSKFVVAIFAIIVAVFLIFNITNKRIIKAVSVTTAVLFVVVNLGVYLINYNRLQLSVANVGNGTSVILTYKGKTAVIGCGGDYFAEASICDIMKSYGVTTIDYLILPDVTAFSSSEANSLLQSYNVKSLYLPDEKQINSYLFSGDTYIIDKTIISIANDELIIAVEAGPNSSCAQIFFGSFRAVVSLSDYNILNDATGDILICRRKIPDGTSAVFFDMVVLSDSTTEFITDDKYLPNIYPTLYNGSISFLIKSDSSYIKWRLV